MKLELNGIIFYSKQDEFAFLDYLKAISQNIEMNGSKIIIEISENPDEDDLRNVFGLVERYQIIIDNIQKLITPENRDFILNKSKYWWKYFT